MPYQAITSFTPDAEPTIPGTLRATTGLLPTSRGVEGFPTAVDAGSSATVTSSVVGAMSFRLPDNSTRTIVGTATALWEIGATSKTDQSKAGGYSIATDTRWVGAQYGNRSYMANKSVTLQKSVSSGAFDDETAAPKAAIIVAVGNFNLGSFLMAFNTNDASFGDSPDRWWACAIGDPTTWTPSIATQAASNRLTSTPGKITAAWPLGDDVVAFKENSCYLGRYVGPPVIWDFTLISDQIGAPCQHAVVPISETELLVFGYDDFYRVTPSRIEPIPNELSDWLFNQMLDRTRRDQVVGLIDRVNQRVKWNWPSDAGTGGLDKYVAYYYGDRQIPRWTVGDETVAFSFELTLPGIAYDDLGSLWATYQDIPASLNYDSTFFLPSTSVMGTVTGGGIVQKLTGPAGASSLTLWDIGDEKVPSHLSTIRPRFITKPVDAKLIPSTRDNLGDALESANSSTALYAYGNFMVEKAARYHSERLDFSGSVELAGVYVDIQADADE